MRFPQYFGGFIRTHFIALLDSSPLRVTDEDLDKLSVALGQPVARHKGAIEQAISHFAGTVWFESIAPNARDLADHLSSIRDTARQFEDLFYGAGCPPVLREYIFVLCASLEPPLDPHFGERPLAVIADLADDLARHLRRYSDRRKRHEVAFKDFLRSLVFVARRTEAGIRLPKNDDIPELRTRVGYEQFATPFLKFAHTGRLLGCQKAILAIQKTAHLKGGKRAIENVLGYKEMTWRPFLDTLREVRYARGGEARRVIEARNPRA